MSTGSLMTIPFPGRPETARRSALEGLLVKVVRSGSLGPKVSKLS